jgi:hypothetical protein
MTLLWLIAEIGSTESHHSAIKKEVHLPAARISKAQCAERYRSLLRNKRSDGVIERAVNRGLRSANPRYETGQRKTQGLNARSIGGWLRPSTLRKA